MDEEYFIAMALPVSVSADAGHHASVFIAPKLSAAPQDRRLDEFRVFPDWAENATTAIVELVDQNGTIECTPLTDAIRPDVWRAVFAADTPVRTNALPGWGGRRWRSFSAKTVHDIGKLVHLQTIYADPTTPPSPTGHPLAQGISEFTSDAYSAWDLPDGYDRRFRYDERRLTEQLDDVIESDRSLAAVEREVRATDNFVERMFLELHRARRYYERPESDNEYFARGEAESVRLPMHGPEFHERVAMAGDHPALLRALGLVIDLRVDDPARLRQSEWLSVSVAQTPDLDISRRTRVRVRALADDSFVTVSETDDWSDGALALGDEAKFAVLDLEADGTALKTERFLWTLPRLLEVQENEDPVNAATPALRASGFTIARTSEAIVAQQQVERQTGLADVLGREVGAADAPSLSTEDVNRGMRVEVWDDTVGKWFSLHSRLTDVIVDGHGVVLDDLPQEGFIQGTTAHETPGVAASPVHVHEAMFGWEGWSLSAPRPGKRVRNERGTNPDGTPRMDELAEETPDDEPPDMKTHPIRFHNEVAPGTLPRLRFGRDYAFRAWSVDLAGNSRAHELNPQPLPPAEIAAAFEGRQVGDILERWRGLEQVGRTRSILAGLRRSTKSAFSSRRADVENTATGSLPDGSGFVGDDVLAIIGERLRDIRRSGIAPRSGQATVGRPGLSSRRGLVNEVVENAVVADDAPFVLSTAKRTVHEAARLLGSQAALLGPAFGAGGGGAAAGIGGVVAAAANTVTALRPYLRWDPIPSPAIVPRARYTEGESLRVIVIRSGVTQDPVTLELTVSDPAAYAAEVGAVLPDSGYVAISERHLAPPKTSQVQAEQHGKFDAAFGSSSPDAHRSMLAWALRENGSFFDLEVAHPTDPAQTVPQLRVRLEQNPAEPRTTPKTLPLPPGDAPEPGQYVVHDVDDLHLPYLPDPLADGISLVFPEAAADRSIPFPFGTEGFTARYPGEWPFIEPFRLTLEGGTELDAQVAGRQVRLVLPPGDLQRFRLSSSLDRARLAWLGAWRSMPAAITGDASVEEAARDGLLWGLTPSEDVLLVHAVPRPLEAPRPTVIRPMRAIGKTACFLFGGVDVHGPSTDHLTAEATWDEPIDDITLAKWETRSSSGIAFTTPILPFEDLALLAHLEVDVAMPGAGRMRLHAAVHNFADTRHRTVSYRFRATTRFREYFNPSLVAPGTDPLDDGKSVVGPEVLVSIPSSAVPAAPVVHSVIPLFRWSDGEEPEQPMARRHTRRDGVRIYLERPWFSSGDGELLGVLLAVAGNDAVDPEPEDQSGFPFVSKWGGDPVWISSPVAKRPLSTVQLDNLFRSSGVDDHALPGRPIAGPVTLPLPDGGQSVIVLGYRPQYNEQRKLWYVDVTIDPSTAFWPFVRLAVARYQPDSVAGAHLSAPVRADFVQLPPERVSSVSRTDDRHVRVVLSGPVGTRHPFSLDHPERSGTLAEAVSRNRIVVASLQRADAAIGGDLGWRTITTTELVLRGRGVSDAEAAWVGELGADDPIPFDRPGRSADWRVRIEEWERFEGDPPSPADRATLGDAPLWEQRLVFADDVAL